ncbi:MAG: 30S ribosomal protein S6e [Candidatus Altiarchaeales archaeon]|nr:MAG: 30S ribosomal protein S6e [Candidatus Altiarchaeales archaeon]RLI94737.1 MAG: 30S ribosomal protein S6e [Candidatus Altiarchaeales archaeon]RLI94831.1 MAG: 30S ribosomal protein S6e [Candidatus Altiarchaeales archaeon]HDO82691.1 30S ribosomal protein S6e [Candidatus Altiarchaeales archaeon]HEX55340.1 30S ribosomal protein S6e [Candidatus Altiarchaeales archaeon]
MEFKLVISDPKTGKSYQREVKDEIAKRFKGMKIGDAIDGAFLGMSGYKLVITGGSDRDGFPMKKGVHGARRVRILMSKGVGYRGKQGVRRRKMVRGEVIDDDIVQINLKITKFGKKSIEDIFGISDEKKDEEKDKKE